MIALLLGLALAASPGWEPTTWPSPGAGVSAAPPAPPPHPGLVEGAFRWYRGLSARNGANCPFFPTCSGYGLQAWREWGFPVSIWLTTDRLLREYPWMGAVDDYPIVTPHRTPRFDDPVPRRHRHAEP